MSAILRRVAITGAGGRLGTALLRELAGLPEADAVPWRRPEYDLDEPAPEPLLDRDRPSLVIDAAAWTDVDGCARDPELAMRRNAGAAAALAQACAARGIPLVIISTSEVFDGERVDRLAYRETDEPRPRNPYGASKLAAEVAAQQAFGGQPGLWIVRTGWLYGAPGHDFPEKILAAADRLPAAEPLPVVVDEVGSPTFSRDLAWGLLKLVTVSDGGIYHLRNKGRATRYEWAAQVLARCRPGRTLKPIQQSEYQRASNPPKWGVLDGAKAAKLGLGMYRWRRALGDYLDSLCPG